MADTGMALCIAFFFSFAHIGSAQKPFESSIWNGIHPRRLVNVAQDNIMIVTYIEGFIPLM